MQTLHLGHDASIFKRIRETTCGCGAQVLNGGDFFSTLRHLDMSHNLLTSIPPDIGKFRYYDVHVFVMVLFMCAYIRNLEQKHIDLEHEHTAVMPVTLRCVTCCGMVPGHSKIEYCHTVSVPQMMVTYSGLR
jgi:hypothetical protein